MEVKPIIKYWDNGNIKRKCWYINNNKFHRVDGPAYICFYKSGEKEMEQWFLNDVRHREDGPTIVSYYKSGKIEEEEWFIDVTHRVEGPAYICYFESGETLRERWYINDDELKDNELIEYKEWLIDNNLAGKNYSTWTDEEKVLWRLRWK